MADSKLSQLTAASTPTGSELVYVVQGGNSRRTTAQALANLAPGTDLTWDASTRTIASSTGGDVVLSLATTSLPGLMSAADKALVGVAATVTVAVRNSSGVTIPKGAAVYVSGSSGTTISVALADASGEATAAQTLGLAQAAIPNNSNGTVIAVGELTGLDTAALTEGAIVWLSETTGALTTTRPTQPAHGVQLGICVKQGAGTAGIVYVRVANGQELEELHDVLLVSPAAGQVLRRASDGLWKNAQLAYSDLSGLPDLAGTYQPLDADLTAIAALTTDAYGRSLLTASSAASARSLLDAAQSAHGHWLFSSSNDGFVPSPGALGANYYLNAAGSWTVPAGGGGGSYSSFTAPTGFSVSGSGTASIVLSYSAGYALPTTASQANWDTAYAERAQWDGGATGLTAATGRTSLGLGDSATRNVGTAGGTVAAGDDSRIVGALQATAAATTYQPLDADLSSIAALSTTTFGRSLLTQADAAATITTLGALSTAAAATTYQPLDADLTAIAALATTTFGRSLLTQADAATARATLDAAQAAHVHAVFTSSAAGYVPASGGGTTNFLRADGTFAAPPGGGGAANYQEFTSSGTWTKPAGCTHYYAEVVGGGGGGGGGRSGASTSARSGGGGGAGGTLTYRWGRISDFGATESISITIGAGGTGGISGTNANGGSGAAGGTSSFGSVLSAIGGSGGTGGTSSTGAGGTIRFRGNAAFGAGFAGAGGAGARGDNSTASGQGAIGAYGPGGGGGGGGITANDTAVLVPADGGAGFAQNVANATMASASTGGASTLPGDGGGGGAASTTGAGTSGGSGVLPGGGGGGGGACTNTAASGAGGNGAAGIVRIWCW